MDVERAAKRLQSVTGLIGIIGGLLAAIAAFNRQLREAVDVFVHIGLVGLVTIAVLLFVVGTAMFINGRRKGSRLLDPDTLRLDPRNPEHLIGRSEEVRLLREKCEARPLVFLVGDSGSGKSALVQAGLLPAAGEDGRLLPVYLDMADLDWEAGPLAALADRFWRSLKREERDALGAPRPPTADDLPRLLRTCYPTLGRTPLLMLDQIDDYQLRHRQRFLPPTTRSWLPASELVARNAFWATLAEMVTARHAHLLLVTRSDNADGLESLRLSPEPLVVRLDPLPADFVLGVLDQLTVQPADAPPVIERPEQGWTRLRARLAEDLERGGTVLPQQLKVALLGLARLKPLSVLAYDRAGGAEGLEARYVESTLARAAARAGLTPAMVRGAVLRLVDAEAVRRGPPLTVGELAEGLADGDVASLSAALEALEEADVLRRREADELPAFQLDHDYLARGILRAEANANRWKALLARRAREFADARGSLRARWRTMLGLREQLTFLFARLVGRFRYGEQRGYALVSAVPYAISAAAMAMIVAGSRPTLEIAGSEFVLSALSSQNLPAPQQDHALATVASFGLPGRAWFAYRLFSVPQYSSIAGKSPEQIARALVGLNEDQAVLLGERLLAPRAREKSPEPMALLPLLPPKAVARFSPRLADAIAQAQTEGRPIDEDFLFETSLRGWEADVPEGASASVVEEVVEPSGERVAAADQGGPAPGPSLGARRRQMVDRQLQLLDQAREDFRAKAGQPGAVSYYAGRLAGMARGLMQRAPEVRAEIVGELLKELRAHRGDEPARGALALALEEVGPTLSPEQARAAAARLLEEIRVGPRDPWIMVSLARAYAATAPANAVDRLTVAAAVREELGRSRDLGVTAGLLAEAYASLTLPWPAEAAGRGTAMNTVLQAVGAARNQRSLPAASSTEHPVDIMREILEACGLGECFALLAGTLLDAANAQSFEARAALVLELLKVPASTRLRLTEALLARLRAEPGADAAGLPGGSLWDVAAWAEQRGLDPGQPLDSDRLFAALPGE